MIKKCAQIMKQSWVPIEHLSYSSNQPTTSYSSIHTVRARCPYSPDLAPFDFELYHKVKSQLNGRRFSSLPDFRSASANIISQYNQDWYRAIFNKWVKRHRKCKAYNGEYFEKKVND